jgi:dienelactone hydrolase
VRCALYPAAVPPPALAPAGSLGRDYSTEKPVGGETFDIFRRIYAYDRLPLDAKTESVDDSNVSWRKEKVSYTAAYGGERIPAWLFLPKNTQPPYQSVLYVPGGDAFALRNSQAGMRTNDFDFLLRTGRAVLYPVYSGTFERHRESSGGPYAQREWTILLAKDVLRSVDYLQSRPDLQPAAVAYYGLSIGGAFGPIFLALEPRFKTSVLVGGALLASKAPPEVDVVNFAPRVAVPVLMLNGRLDFQNPYETLQKPLFRWLGVAEPDKRHVLFETGHLPPVQDLMRETLSWLDQYLGPVTVRH